MRFVFDNNFSPRLPAALRALALEPESVHITDVIVSHLEGQPGRVDDDIWLRHLAADDFVITQDAAMGRSKVFEAKTIRTHEVGLFTFSCKNFSGLRIAEMTLHQWEKLKDEAATRKRPFMLRVPPKGDRFDNILR